MAVNVKEYLINAGLIKRLAAFVIDLFILNFIALQPFRSLFSGKISSSSIQDLYNLVMSNNSVFQMLYLSSVFIGFIILLYFVVMEWKTGQTIGKMIFGIYVVSTEEAKLKKKLGDRNLKFWQAIAENMMLIPIFPFFLLIVIDPIYMVFSRENQRLSEKIGKVMVVEKYYV